MSHDANPTRSAYVKALATVGAEVYYLHPHGKVRGTITRTTEASVWVKLELPGGQTPTFRFSQRETGEYIMSGKGKYGPTLNFTADPNYYGTI
ncbi:hypothetical protein SEA_WALTZ_53 [Arthrobacter phage Waltz]|nr:hypothetical protein SEA_WALTZ_53 [Arthrobacter phage Waltz]